MNTSLLSTAIQFTPIFAQSTLSEGSERALGIVMLIGFIFGIICVIGGGFAIRRGDTDAGKLSIIGGLISNSELATKPRRRLRSRGRALVSHRRPTVSEAAP